VPQCSNHPASVDGAGFLDSANAATPSIDVSRGSHLGKIGSVVLEPLTAYRDETFGAGVLGSFDRPM
jgi:hypothetical protein